VGDFCQARIKLAHHAEHTTPTARHHFGVAKDIDEMTCEWNRLALVAGVEVHLATAGLLQGKSTVWRAFQHPHRRLASLRKQRVVKTAEKKRYLH
jgi:hypothetical protein